ncbi:MAG TPA: flagellar hook-basal body complex protein [Clostridia bacterium]|nr:flagellar hook-basal body complex protein [Clostridia bacterium]
MMRSMYAAVAGLRTHQTRMDVIGDNIANVNTPGFKRARATFQDIFYQTLQGGSSGSATRGGTNPQQIGIGISLGTIDVIHTQGAAQTTGKEDDLMIEGDGFFVLSDGKELFYTRAGAFRFVPYEFGDDNELGNIGVESGRFYLVNPANGLFVLDAEGKAISIPADAKSFNFDTNGYLHFVDAQGVSRTYGADDDDDVGVPIAIAKFINPAGLEKVGQNMYRYSQAAVGGEGPVLTNNGFDNNDINGNTNIIDSPGGDRGIVRSGALEMSNVELAMEFTDMIVTQRGFQANARVISVSDEMLAELANLKR